jgi:hypothetical protein
MSGAKARQGLRYRVGMAYPIKLEGKDEQGQDFLESSVTQFVMRDGITAIASKRLAVGSRVRVILAKEKWVLGQVIGQTGFTKTGNVYALAIKDDPSSLWGIAFPELSENDRAELNCVLSCGTCRARSIVQLTAVEHELLVTSERVARHCPTCKGISIWKRVPDSIASSSEAKENPAANRRRYSRVNVKLWGYIVDGGNEDSIPILDVSRDGIRFRSSIKYEVEQVVQVAVAYMAGTANIFVPGRIVWRSGDDATELEYGLRFMSRSPIL